MTQAMPGGASSSTRLGGLALAFLMLVRQHSSAQASVEPHRSCKIVGEPLTAAEDGSLWRMMVATCFEMARELALASWLCHCRACPRRSPCCHHSL